ncbi:MBL fold metallo-hydrolase [Pleionea sp. CnH1-48]|uniref:MBL fold metallo-hydrolase n=1 Tax=Pleionea sp. CnH1-48 TaxID=2954494 RepID=UPI0020983810|nr:MBL fold metallo-hydrolase [Pleionea sp. CnH1-48]MCO7223046.1 MBL fold metallo-hydrolase [Pleionea sp. CnH1-48]
MMVKYFYKLIIVLTSFIVTQSLMAESFDPSKPIVKRIDEGIYQYFHQFYNSLIIIGSEGVIVTDPSGAERASVMREEIRKLTNKPVIKVIYSHDHYDHTRGGQIFQKEGAEFIAHKKAVELLKRDPYQQVVLPNKTYTDKLRITSGNKVVVLIYMGPNDGDAMSVIYLPKEKILFAVDFHLPRYVNEPYRLTAHNYGGIYQTMKRIRKELSFETVISGHTLESSPDLFEEDFRFVEALYNAVLKGLKSGKSTKELKQSVKLPDFKHWQGYEKNLPGHVERMAYTIWHGN